MVARNRARYLAPIALTAVIAGAYVVVHSGLTTKKASSAHARGAGGRKHHRLTRSRFYVVQAGDNMTAISAKTGVSIATLEALNPRVEPNSLQTGQRLRLRR